MQRRVNIININMVDIELSDLPPNPDAELVQLQTEAKEVLKILAAIVERFAGLIGWRQTNI